MRFLSRALVLILLFSPALLFAAEEEETKPKTIGYFDMKPSLVTNVQGNGKYVRCDVQLMTRDDADLPDIETHSPALRHELLMLLGDQKAENLKDPKGKEKFRGEALKSLQEIMKREVGKAKIDDLYFTAFFVR